MPASVADAEREMAAARRIGVRFIALGEAEYPAALQTADSAPPLIAVRGNAGILRKAFVAIVGSRNASALGLKFTTRIARDLGQAGYAIASGLARGIDTAAHESSLETGTVAVLAGGPDYIYPPQNGALFHRILETGAVISEMPVGYEPRARDFHAATASSPASRSAHWWWRRPRGQARSSLRSSPPNRGARCLLCLARRSIRAQAAPMI